MMRRFAAVLAAVALLLTAAPASLAGAGSAVAGCAKPTKTKKAATKMDYGSGTLGPLGSRVLDGDMATADVGIFGFGAQMDRILAYLASKGVEHVLWIDVQACRSAQTAAVKLADQRNSMAINMQIHERLPGSKVVPWAWSFISNPARLAMYLQDGVHPWAGPTGPNGADGTANWRAWIMTKLGPLL